MRNVLMILIMSLLNVTGTFSQCWSEMDLGEGFNLAIAPNGTLWAWGKNNTGQLGDGTSTDKSVPTQIGTETNWAKISAGYNTSLAIKTDGTLWAWGNNEYGQIGDNTFTPRATPRQIGTATDWAYVEASTYCCYAIKMNGSLWAWGRNNYGCLGIGNQTDKKIPTRVGTDTDWLSIKGIGNNAAGLKTNGGMWLWGQNNSGQLGEPPYTYRLTPARYGTDTWISAEYGDSFLIAIKSDGTMWSCGTNSVGETGLGLPTGSSAPSVGVLTQIGTDTNWQKVSCGSYYAKAIKTNGLVYGWGYVSARPPGYVSAPSNSPSVETNQTWRFINSGYTHNVQITSDETIWMLGWNGEGELGNGQPVQDYIHSQLTCPALNIIEFSDNKKYVLYPNPVADNLFIDNLSNKQFKATVSDISGKEMLVCSDCEKLDLTGLSSGFYFMRIDSEDNSKSYKFIKK